MFFLPLDMDAIQEKISYLLEDLSARFTDMFFAYGYDAATRQHVVAVGPEEMYRSPAYMLAEGDVYSAWDAVYPSEDLVFVSMSDPYHQVTNPHLTFAPKRKVRLVQLTRLLAQSLTQVDGYKQPVSVSSQAIFADFSGGCLKMPGKAIIVHPAFQRSVSETGSYNAAMAA